MVRYLKATAVAVGVIGAVMVAVAMLLGPLTDDPGPDVLERFVIFAYPLCLLMGGIFAALRLRIGVVYGLLAIGFAVAFVVIRLLGDDGPEQVPTMLIFAALVIGPALILTSLCWSAMREEARLALVP